jgi:hypothetical protein
MEKTMENMEMQQQVVVIQGTIIKHLQFADDIDLLAEAEDHLQVQLAGV